jgi:ATP-dependent helicase/nuclease subunit B
MPAAVRIVCGPAGSGKTTLLLEQYRAAHRAGIGTALWLVPTYRHAEALRSLLPAAAVLAPNLWTFQDFADAVVRANDPAAQPLSNVQRRLLADELVAALHGGGELSHFARVIETRGFADGVFALLAELKRHEILPQQFADHAATPKERQCARLYARYQDCLARLQCYDPEGRQWYARDLLGRGQRRPFEAVRFVFVDGFTDFTRTQREILDALAQQAEALWIALPNEPDDERAELFTRSRQTVERLRPLRPEIVWLPSRAVRRPFASSPAPAGLAHLAGQLFRPLRRVRQSDRADGICCVAAPGMLGEARLVARRVKTHLLASVPAEDIVVTVRDLIPYADLLREVFAEYGVPVDVEGADPLARNPAVTALLRALRLPDEGWPFAGVTALLRSNYFRPDWPESRADPEVAQHAEVLLRLLGEPRGRAAYLEAVRRWAERPEPGLEDEQAEQSRRQRIHELAQRCRPFLQRFFHAWDGEPEHAPLEDYVAWLRAFADDLGFARAAKEEPRDAAALDRLWEELDAWLPITAALHDHAQRRKRRDFQRLLGSLAAEAGLARTPRGPGRVRVLSAALARTLETPYLFVLGLGERSFPRLAPPDPLFDEPERQAFKQAGLDVLGADDLLPEEMLLFYQLVTRARRELVLSYPAVDGQGQSLLPGSFLTAVPDCFGPDAVPVERRQMLLEGFAADTPLSPAEYRVRVAAAGAGADRLPAELAANLSAAKRAAWQRFDAKEHGPYDGLLRHPAVLADLRQAFGPEKVFSPTALEDYIACPFRFFLRHVLRLEPVEDPSEEIEHTRRGQAFHRALSRLHQQLKAAEIHQPTEAVDAQLLERMTEAVGEYIARAPSPASKELWRLEGERLLRRAARYGGHWRKFLEPWRPKGVVPRPHFFEVDFGLPSADGSPEAPPLVLRGDDVEVRVSGRIDRVDVAELADGLGFWIIDYKTGRSHHYTAADLRAFRRLQLTLYALAVECVLLAGRPARPLGLAYWMVAENGPKPALPGSGRQVTAWLERVEDWTRVRQQLERWVTTLVAHIRGGAFPLQPRSETCTATCDYSEVCRISQARGVVTNRAERLPLPVVTEVPPEES